LSLTWPVIRALRHEHFDRSVDFASNDRGAILSRLIGAKRRLGWSERGGFLGRRLCYTERVANDDVAGPESARLARLLSGWQVPPPASLESEIRADPALAETARGLLPEDRAVICHAASSQPRKEWPLSHWAALHQLATKAGYHLVFTTARGGREAALMNDLRRLVPGARVLPEIGELALFLAVLARARVFIAGDTGPLHFAAGLGVSTIALFGPTSPDRWAPVGSRHRLLVAGPCTCPADAVVCTSTQHCLANIQPAQVLDLLASAAGGHA
jgi:ADP-heptose:LPS heptosyltransferase